MKRHSTFLRRTLMLVYGTVLLFAVLIIGIYNVISPRLFAQNKIDDLIPKGQIIAGYIESTLRGEISTAYLVPLIGRSTSQWEATVWVVDASGDTLIRTQQSSGRRVGKLPAALANSMLPTVLSGEIATHIGSPEDLVATRSSMQENASDESVLGGIAQSETQESDSSGEEVMTGSIVAVALPITFWGDVVGAVFMAQSMTTSSPPSWREEIVAPSSEERKLSARPSSPNSSGRWSSARTLRSPPAIVSATERIRASGRDMREAK